MFSVYFLIFIINARICWYYLVLPFDDYDHEPWLNVQDFKDAGEPLILTPYLEANQISKARELSSVESLLSDEKVYSNAGFFTVDEDHHSNLYFWFFRQRSSNWQNAPILLWLNGGPGCSSLYGLFEENGPFTVTEDGIEKRKYSWIDDYNMIYIDQPVGSGFSFTKSSNGYINTQEKVADHLYSALTQFFLLYPELRHNAFYIAGESYAGRYIPSISYKIHKAKMANLTDINLKGLFMISAKTEGLVNGWAEYCFEIGLIDSQTKIYLETMEQEIASKINSENWGEASSLSSYEYSTIRLTTGVNVYDYTKSKKSIEYYIPFLENSAVRKKIHVGNEKYDLCNSEVRRLFSEDIPKSVVPWIEKLVNHYSVAFVGGQFDIAIPYPLVVNVMEKLNWNGSSNYKTAERKTLGGENVDGYIKSAGNLKDILVRNAGHMVPKDQPRVTLDLLKKFVNDEL